MVEFILGVIATIVFISSIIKDKKEYFKSKKLVEFTPAIIGSVLLIGFLTIAFILYQRDSSPSKLYCSSKNSSYSGVSIDFRKDGTYKLTSWSLGADYYRGNYSINDNIIEIDTSGIENILSSNRLVIVPETEIYEKKTIHQKSIYQIDSNGNRIESVASFVVIDD